MTDRIGASLEDLSRLNTTFNREAAAVEELTNVITGALDSTWWEGPAGERFRQSWSAEFRPVLSRLAQNLTELGVEVNRRRTAIEQAGS